MKNRLIVLDNQGKSDPNDFTIELLDPVQNVFRIELVSATMDIGNVYATVNLSFSPEDTFHSWPLFKDVNYDSPVSVDKTNRYFVAFEQPPLDRLRKIRVLVDNAGAIDTRVTMILNVESSDALESSESKFLTVTDPKNAQRDYLIVDNRSVKSSQTSFDFVPDVETFRNVSRLSLREVIVSRTATTDSYVNVNVMGFYFTAFFKYGPGITALDDTYGPLNVGTYSYYDFTPPLSALTNPRVQITGPGGASLSATDPIVVLLFEVSHTPYYNIATIEPNKEQYAFELLDNRAQSGTSRYDYVHTLGGPLKNITRIELKALTFPADATERPYYVTVEFPDLALCWNVPYGTRTTESEPHNMIVRPYVHRRSFKVPVNLNGQLRVRYKSPNGSLYVHPVGSPESPVVMLLSLTYDPRI
jgi:hypothetical protein